VIEPRRLAQVFARGRSNVAEACIAAFEGSSFMRYLFPLAVCALLFAVERSVAAQAGRTVPHRYGVPLAKQAECATSETIHFPHKREGIIFIGDLTAESYLDYAIDVSHFALVFLVDQVKPTLTENDTWIVTRVSGVVEEGLWFRKSKLPRYSRLTIQLPDGAMEINGCKIITGTPVPMEIGQRYLVFLQELLGPYGMPSVNPIWIRDDERLESSSQAFLRNVPLDLMRERVRKEPSRRLLPLPDSKQ
jgi:hypothetical protein